jgi:DNA-binding transcriptional ArsR family regulator
VDKRLWHLIVGTRGGLNRAKIVNLLRARPYNANALAAALKLDYKTVRHHLKVLIENDIVMASRDQKYGTLYFLTPRLQNHFEDFLEIWEKVKKDESRMSGVPSDERTH